MDKRRDGWRRVGIEPMMFLYMFGFMITSVIEDAFFVYKACRVDSGYPEEICRNISQPIYNDIKNEVQVKVSTFYQWNNIAYHIVPIMLSFYLGAWSDQVGRKLPILVGIAGNVYYSSMIVVISLMETWPLDTVIWLASFPCALTGSSLTVFMATFSYLADTTTTEERTLRTTLVEVAYLLPMPLGVALGSYLFYNIVSQSFAIMFVISASLHVTAMLVAWILLDWKTNRSVPKVSSSVLSVRSF
uniref:Solute carrier family 46 member 3 n=3 Tax=Lygus hesperus TaxID=30085 RepID=A0A0A9ZJG9_LYGHE